MPRKLVTTAATEAFTTHGAERADRKRAFSAQTPHRRCTEGWHRRALSLHISQPQTKTSTVPEGVLPEASNTMLPVPFRQEATHFIMKTQKKSQLQASCRPAYNICEKCPSGRSVLTPLPRCHAHCKCHRCPYPRVLLATYSARHWALTWTRPMCSAIEQTVPFTTLSPLYGAGN